MKKYMSAVAVAVVGLAMIGAWGCGGGDDDPVTPPTGGGTSGGGTGGNSGIVGTWTLQSLSSGGQTISAADAGVSWTMTFTANGTCTVTINGDSASGTYSANGGTLSVEGQVLGTYTLSGNTLHLNVTAQGQSGTLNFTR